MATISSSNDLSVNTITSNNEAECFAQPLPPSSLIDTSKVNSNLSIHVGSKSASFENDGSLNFKPEKVKSRWRRNSELESGHKPDHVNNCAKSASPLSSSSLNSQLNQSQFINSLSKQTDPIPEYDHIEENIYLFERRKSKSKKEMRRMVCNCILTKEERQRGVRGCLDDCLNRMLMIECGSRCLLGDHCANKRFQKKFNAKVEPFKTEKKGWGLRSLQSLQPGTFIVEYVGEVLDSKEFKARVKKYSKENREHFYFMALRGDEIIDATIKGNVTRFINHSCDPNGETQKWTVNGELRIGFFAKRYIEYGEEITFDYQFQRYGKKAQKCYCESANCRKYIGGQNMNSINIDGSLISSRQRSSDKDEADEKSLTQEFEDLGLDEEVAKLSTTDGIRNRQQTLMIARFMVRAEDTTNRIKLLEILKATHEVAYLRLFLDYHGLQLLWSWMVDLEDAWLKAEILAVLGILPIPNKTVLKDSKVYDVIERWSKIEDTKSDINSILSITAQLPSIVEPNEEESFKNSEKAIDSTQEVEEKSNCINEVNIKAETEDDEDESQESQEKVKIDDELESKVNKDNAEASLLEEGNCESKVDDIKQESNGDEYQVNKTEISKTLNNIKRKIKQEINDSSKDVSGDESKENIFSRVSEKEVEKPVPNIAQLALKLLYSWKDLKEGFRIPRLERQKRLEDEKEADKKTLELEERRQRGLPIIYDPKAKRGIDNRDNSIAGILGLKKKNVKRNVDEKKPFQTNSYFNSSPAQQIISSTSGGDMAGPTPPKINKESHRMQFQMELMRKQYEEAMKNYHKQMQEYHTMVQQQIMHPQLHSQLPQQPQQPPPPPLSQHSNFLKQAFIGSSSNLSSHHLSSLYGSDGSSVYTNNTETYPLSNDSYSLPIMQNTCLSNDYHQSSFHLDSSQPSLYQDSTSQLSSVSESFNSTIDENQCFYNSCLEDNLMEEPPSLSQPSTLIECTNSSNHSLLTDEKAVIQTDYGVEYVTNEPLKPVSWKDKLFNQVYPAPGIYYLTSDNCCHFIPSPFDTKGHQIEPVVFENIPQPLLPSSTKETVLTALPRNWRSSKDADGNIYYYNIITKSVQWNLPEVDMTSVSQDVNLKAKESVVVSNADSTSTPRDEIITQNMSSVSLASSQSSPQATSQEKLVNGEKDSTTPQDLASIQESIECSGTPITALPGSQAYDVDPRKRKHLNNSLNQNLSKLPLIESNENDIIACKNKIINEKNDKLERRIKEKFKAEMSEHIKYCLNPYRKLDCRVGRIICNDDFKYVARRLTHFVMVKELKHCRTIEELCCSDTVKHKAKDYVRKYMAKQGPLYKPESTEEKEKISPKDVSQESGVNHNTVDTLTNDQ